MNRQSTPVCGAGPPKAAADAFQGTSAGQRVVLRVCFLYPRPETGQMHEGVAAGPETKEMSFMDADPEGSKMPFPIMIRKAAFRGTRAFFTTPVPA